MTAKVKRALQQSRQEMQQFQYSTAKPGNKPTMSKETHDFLAELFGENTVSRLSSKAGVGFKDTSAKVELSEPLYQAIVDELGEEVAERIADMLAVSDDEQPTPDTPEGEKSVDPWAWAKSTQKPHPEQLIRRSTDSFWKAFLK